MKRLLLDTNVLLDVLLRPLPWQVEADAILTAFREGRLLVVVSALTVANAFYVGRRIVGTEAARNGIRDCLDAFEIVPLDHVLLCRKSRCSASCIGLKRVKSVSHSPRWILPPATATANRVSTETAIA